MISRAYQAVWNMPTQGGKLLFIGTIKCLGSSLGYLVNVRESGHVSD